MNLPVEKYKNEIIEKVLKNTVTIIKGSTGCGKSTMVPLILSNHFEKIALIEPRRIAVISLFKRLKSISEESIGYKIRFDKKVKKENKIVIFTDGMFLKEENDFDLVILDEVHERSLRIDLLISLFKLTNQKLVLMSANVDTEKFTNFFNTTSFIDIKHNSFPLNIVYEENPVCDYVKSSFLKIKEIILLNLSGDILCFLPGEEDIKELFLLCKNIPLVKVYKIHSTMNDFDQQKIFESSNCKKIILSTNICESSLTIPGISFVIDTGLQKSKIMNVTNNLVGINYFGIEKISKQSAEQRAGRSNREGTGHCYRLYTKESFSKLKETTPEITKSDLKDFFLFLIYKKINFLKIKMLDLPNKKHVGEALNYLWENKLIKLQEESLKSKKMPFKISKKGKEVIKLPLPVNISVFLYECRNRGLSESGEMICSLLSLENFNFIPKSKNISDLSFLLQAMKGFISAENKIEFCIKNDLPHKGMEKGLRIFQQLKTKKDTSEEDIDRIFSDVFWYNASVKEKYGIFKHRKSGNLIYWYGNESKITYIDVFYNGKAYARIVGKYFE
ncbi:HrpA-like helicase [Tubulinosema ratisbonensis]|uniref:HrpA-like helicase n=1 Tax=Tubulinosema ratisbonensis TaxID=291195 RepID=A0A437ANQ8_9MICR|nr:HrpA-like helicase [Tubulinosema ratisbonensis]